MLNVKNPMLVVLLLFVSSALFCQKKYWQQQANFNINVSLNDKEHTLDAFESIEYFNHSPDTLTYIFIHLWPNAYKNDKTFFSEQLLANGNKSFYFSKPADKGYINQLEFKVDNIAAATEDYLGNIDVIKLKLPKPLLPSKKITITTPFHVKLPYNFSRGGHVGNDYQITQWFPKPAVYDTKGWHPMPYADQGEFYSEFGSFDVQVTAPAGYMVAGTGVLQDEATRKQIETNGKLAPSEGNTTWHFKQDRIHDFAWFASREFIASHDTVILPSKKIVNIYTYYKEKDKGAWKESVAYAKAGVKNYSNWIGEYPYATASVVQGSKNENSGGMEYPTITLITTQSSGHELDATIVHEVGHNWFYGTLASNERDHPWMDEGMNTFYQKRYELNKYGTFSYLKDMPKGLGRKLPEDEEILFLRMMTTMSKDQPIETLSIEFSEINYGVIAYIKASRWMSNLEDYLGTKLFDSCMRTYNAEWQFKHPYPENFKEVMERVSDKPLDKFFDQLYTTGRLTSSIEKRQLKTTVGYNLNSTEKYNYISILPAAGYNNYDKFSFGALVHNYQLPFNRFQFLAGALIANKSGHVNHFGRMSYTVYKKKLNLQTSLSTISFTQNKFTTETDAKLYLRIRRTVPSIKLTLFDKDPRKERQFIAQWKSFLLREDALHFETVITPGNPPDTADIVSKEKVNPNIQRLTLSYSDNRVLYPYTLNLTTDQGKGFIRTGFTADYFFNYANNKSGLKARFFAGKFFYLNEKTFLTRSNTDRYHLNMTGFKGNEDYTYSSYFAGRNEFEGWMNQQIMERDGFFKVRTDLLGDKIGKTDDWLMSLNLVTDLPDKINPLSVLPVKIPIKIFADAGTYSEAWQNNPQTGRFLYDAGLQLSLFNNILNVYFPLIYSKVYSNYFKSTITEKRFQKNISFSIDIQKLKVNQLVQGIPL